MQAFLERPPRDAGKDSVKGRTHHLLLSVWGRRWREVELVMFTVYIDDSGTSPSQHIAIATALVIPAAQILRLESEWDTLQAKEGFSDFSMSEFVYANPKSEFAGWDEPKRERVFRRVRQISKKYGTGAFSVAVNKQDYDDIFHGELRSGIGEHHYTWAVHHLLSFLDVWRTQGRKKPPFEYVFHWMQDRESKTEIENAMERAEDSFIEEGLGLEFFLNYSFRKSKGIPGLQCVDAISWVCYQLALHVFRDKPMHPYAEIGWNDFEGDSGPEGWLRAVAIKREDLQKWFEELQANPENLERLKRLEKKRLARRARA